MILPNAATTLPILVNPEFEELLLLGEHRWDTLRVCASTDFIGIASGYGATHRDVLKALESVMTLNEWHRAHFIDLIAVHTHGRIHWNLEATDGRRIATTNGALRYVDPKWHTTIKELINLRLNE